MKVALLGYDIEGSASYEYYQKQGADITICDQKNDLPNLPKGVATRLGDGYLDGLAEFDVLVRTAGLPPSKILEKNRQNIDNIVDKITTNVNEFLLACPTQNVIGITGTKGKGTTSTLITRILEAAGHTVFLGGNIGVPPLTFLDKLTADSWVVLELSSFQLTDLRRSPHLGVCLMVVPEHLNWHADMADYVEAKSQLFAHQSSEDVAVYYADSETSREIAAAGAGHKFPFYKSPGAWVNGNMITMNGAAICTTDELKLLGKHNWQNVCAAVTVGWLAGVRNPEPIRQVLTTFTGLPHRLEKLREVAGVTYYNDSFAATPDAAIAALQAIPGSKVAIVGGFDRGLPIDHLAKALAEAAELRHVLIIGVSAERLAEACRNAGFSGFTISQAQTMPEIVAQARDLAQTGDAVVLTPGFASFDMFKDFEDRGEQFRTVVKAL